jgi:hypothetical protein
MDWHRCADSTHVSKHIDKPPERPSALEAELNALMRQFFSLSAADQLRALERIRDFLGASAPMETEVDRQAKRESESLAALEQVRDHLGLNGRAPTVKEFDRVARELELGWTARKVGEVWGRYRFACGTLLGEPRRLSPAQRSLRSLMSGRKRKTKDCVNALRLWAATDPPLARATDYDAWAREHNDSLADGELPVPTAGTIHLSLAISWSDALPIGRGDLKLDDAAKRTSSTYEDWCNGPHDFIGVRSAAQILGVSEGRCAYLTHKPGFPTPAAIFGRRKVRAWLRKDIESYRDTGKAPRRRWNELRSQYYDTLELMPLVGLGMTAINNGISKSPRPTGRVVGRL